MVSKYNRVAVDPGRTFVLVPIFENLGTVEVLPRRKKPRESRAVRQESTISRKIIEGSNSIPVIYEKPNCVCDDQGAYSNSEELGVNEFIELGHTPCGIWPVGGESRVGDRTQVAKNPENRGGQRVHDLTRIQRDARLLWPSRASL